MAELPRGTVTFVFTDIEGSTRLLNSLGPSYQDARTRFQSVFTGYNTRGSTRACFVTTAPSWGSFANKRVA